MQDYYNTIPYMARGGALVTIAGSTTKYLEKFLNTSKGINSIKGLSLSLSKKNPELANGLKKLLNKELDALGILDLQKLAKSHLSTLKSYIARKNSLQQAWNYRKQALDFAKKAEAAEKAAIPKKKAYTKPALGSPDEATLRALKAYYGEAPKAGNVVTEAAAKAKGAIANTAEKAGTAVLGRYARIKQAIKNHPWIAGAALVGLTNGTTRDAVGTGLLYYLTPASRWDQIGLNTPTSSAQIRLQDGSVVPISMGSDGVFTIGQQSEESTGVDPTDAAIAQAIAEANTAPSETNPVVDVNPTGGYTTNEDFNDLFENDAWDL